MLHAEPYCGSSTQLTVSGNGQGYDVVIGLAEKVGVRAGCHLFFDNLFTSVSLLTELSQRGIGGVGTVRENRLNGVPLVSKKVLEKKRERSL